MILRECEEHFIRFSILNEYKDGSETDTDAKDYSILDTSEDGISDESSDNNGEF